MKHVFCEMPHSASFFGVFEEVWLLFRASHPGSRKLFQQKMLATLHLRTQKKVDNLTNGHMSKYI